MSIPQKIRDAQDQIRDQGWRIESIPWQDAGRPEFVYNTPLTLMTGLGGATLFFGSIYWLVAKDGQWPALLSGIAGLAIIFLGRLYASARKQAGWIGVTAQCIDLEQQERHYPHQGNIKIIWEYRLLCAFTYNGREYRVTPESSHLAGFPSQERLQKYLDGRILSNGSCRLWIDPKNPLHTIFDKKQWIS